MGRSPLLFVVVGEVVERKVKHYCFPLWGVISCDNGILTHLLLESGKVVYAISSI